MTAREFLTRYSYDDRLVTGEYYSREPIPVDPGDRVGILMMNAGGPETLEDVQPFLYNRFMDPAILDVPLPGSLRDGLSRFIARKRAAAAAEEYRQVGGGSPINRLTREQAAALEDRLNARFGALTGAEFKTYVAMRYWNPTPEEAVQKMAADGITRVVLLPLYPQYSKTTTGSGLYYLKELERTGEMPSRPVSLVNDYATHPLYVQALSDRIDEALRRFPKSTRDKAEILFNAYGTSLLDKTRHSDPYYDRIHATVDAVMALRVEKERRPFHIAFQSKLGFGERLSPSTAVKIEELSRRSVKALVVVPVSYVTDHIETVYELDIRVREEARQAGIQHYEVTNALNCHPLFIDALAESVWSRIESNGGHGDGLGSNVDVRASDAIRVSSSV